MYTIYFIFYQCTNILINLCTLIAYSLMTPQEKKKKTVCFCKILGTISNAIDVFSSFFHVRAFVKTCSSWVWRVICRQRANLSCDSCLWWYGVYFIFLPLPLGQSQRGQAVDSVVLFLRLWEEDKKKERQKNFCVEDPISSENAKKKMTWWMSFVCLLH